MYSGSTEFNNLIEKSGGNALKTRFTFSDFSIEKFTKLEYYGGSNNSNDIAVGTTNMVYLDVSTITDKIITNQEFLFEVGIELSDGTVEYAPMGYFTVQNPDGDEDTVNFKAYDRMQKFEKPYVSSLTYPTNSSQILNELCATCGVELATPIASPITITDKLEGYTCREILGYIAGVHGLFACFDRYGKLNLRWYSETLIEKQIGLIWALTKSQSNYTVEKITIAKDTEATYTSGTGISGINHSNPYATQEIADSIYASLGGFSYSPCEISMLDDIRLDPWDMLKVTYLDGSVLTIPVMSLEHSFTSGETTVKSVGKTDTENEYNYSGPVTQTMDRMATELLVVNRVVATKVDAEYVNAHAITTDNLSAIEAEIKSAVIEDISAEYADIRLANIDTANIDVAKIGLLFTKVGLIDRATIVDGHITGFLDAVEVNANNITAGTLIADRILLKGSENGLLYALNNLGELTSTAVNTLDGTILTQRTVTADKLVANSITANELDVTNIFGNSAVLSTLVSQEAFINAISTNTVVVGAYSKAQGIIDNIYTPGTTTINGGKITTGSITANKIDVNNLVSLSANIGGFSFYQGNMEYVENDRVGYDDLSGYIEFNYISTTLKAVSYTSATDKLFYIGAHPEQYTTDMVGSDGWVKTDYMTYPFYVTAKGHLHSEEGDIAGFTFNKDGFSSSLVTSGKVTQKFVLNCDVPYGEPGLPFMGLQNASGNFGSFYVTTNGDGHFATLDVVEDISAFDIYENGIALSERYAAKSHTHTASDAGALPISGGTLTGQLFVNSGKADKISPANQDIRIDGIVGDTTVSGAPGIGFHQPQVDGASIKYFSGAFRFINWDYSGLVSIAAHNGVFTGELAEENQALSARYARI